MEKLQETLLQYGDTTRNTPTIWTHYKKHSHYTKVIWQVNYKAERSQNKTVFFKNDLQLSRTIAIGFATGI